jgi:hypothetical protein
VLFYVRSSGERTLEYSMAIEAMAVLIVVTVRAIFTVGLIWHQSFAFLEIVAYVEFARRMGPLSRAVPRVVDTGRSYAASGRRLIADPRRS